MKMPPSAQSDLQKNTRRNLFRTLEDWSDQERLIKYQQAVPFVHVPQELLAQWGEYAHLLKEKPGWFMQSLTEQELAAMLVFDTVVAGFHCDDRLPDVPEIFGFPRWIDSMNRAGQLLAVLKP